MKKITYSIFCIMFVSITWCQTFNIIFDGFPTLVSATLFMEDNTSVDEQGSLNKKLDTFQNIAKKNDLRPLQTNVGSSSVIEVKEGVSYSAVNCYKITNRSLRITGAQYYEKIVLKIYSVIGKRVFYKQFSSQFINDILLPENLIKGVYLVNIKTKIGECNKKIIIE